MGDINTRVRDSHLIHEIWAPTNREWFHSSVNVHPFMQQVPVVVNYFH